MFAAPTIIFSALASAPTVAVAVSIAISTSSEPLIAAAALQRGQALPQHGGRRHELPGAQPVPPLGRALPLPLVIAAAVRLAAALLGAVLAPRLAAAADPTVARHGALPAVVQVAAELGREVARRFLQAERL